MFHAIKNHLDASSRDKANTKKLTMTGKIQEQIKGKSQKIHTYPEASEFKDWENLCPVKKFREHLISLDFLSDDIEATLTSTIETEINQAFDSARNAPFPPPESAGLRVYA